MCKLMAYKEVFKALGKGIISCEGNVEREEKRS